MTINTATLAALTPVLSNTWAVELPERPTWPAILFEVKTEPEQTWVLGGGYDQHILTVVTMAKDLDEIEALKPQIKAAMAAIDGFMFAEDEGDAEYEGDPEVFGYFQGFRIRMRTT
jgi:hypothetical protein